MRFASYTACVLFCLMIFASCKKYPDGPLISLQSKMARLARVWTTEQVILNGSDITSLYSTIGYSETYDKAGNYYYSSSMTSGQGRWMFENSHSEIKRYGVIGQAGEDMTILRLKGRSFWYTYTDGKDTFEFHMVSF